MRVHDRVRYLRVDLSMAVLLAWIEETWAWLGTRLGTLTLVVGEGYD